MPAHGPLYCPRCGSDRLQPIKSNGIEPNAGYTCQGCSQTLRRRGSAWLYAVFTALGLVMVPVGIVLIAIGMSLSQPRALFGIAAIVLGLVCGVYAVFRFRHPIPLLVRPEGVNWSSPANRKSAPSRPQPNTEATPRVRWRVTGTAEETGAEVAREVVAESEAEAAAVAALDGMTVTQVDQVT